MGKKKKILKAKNILKSKIFMAIFLIASYFTWLWIVSAVAYADLAVCIEWGPEAFQNSQWPVWFVLWNFNK